jgi:tryptophan synthase beta chain
MKVKFLLKDSEIPKTWYNVMADMPNPPAAVLHPGTGKPVSPDDLAPLFPMPLIEQEVSTQREIPIPEAVREIYTLWRPTPMFRALRLEEALGTKSKIYYKYEGGSPAGSHKPNTSIPQAYYNKMAGRKRIATETGAGQWGSAMALAGSFFGLEVKVYMVNVSYNQKPYRRMLMETWGAKVVASPSRDTNSGRAILAESPNSPGSLGIAISEAVEDAATRDDTSYALGSVLNHVCLHQTVIGLEALPLSARQDRRRKGSADRRGRAVLLSYAHQGDLRLRFRGYGETYAAHQDVYARSRLRARRDSCRGAPVPRGFGARKPAP